MSTKPAVTTGLAVQQLKHIKVNSQYRETHCERRSMWDEICYCHSPVTVSRGSEIFIWGGRDYGLSHSHPKFKMQVFNTVTGEWTKTHSTADPSPLIDFDDIKVIGNKMYGIGFGEMRIHVMDMDSYHIQEVDTSSSILPLTSGLDSRACLWQDKIYLFGGGCPIPDNLSPEQIAFQDQITFDSGVCNQCAAFNTTTHKWEWPRFSGDPIPSPRLQQRCIVNGQYMLLFGGYSGNTDKYLNDLYALHLPTHKWSKLQAATDHLDSNRPQGRMQHSFTSVGTNRAVLYGGISSAVNLLSDCWLLTWSTGPLGIDSIQWSLWSNQTFGPRASHKGEYSPKTSTLYLLGGLDPWIKGTLSSILVNPASLYESSLRVLAEVEPTADIEALSVPFPLKIVIKHRLNLH